MAKRREHALFEQSIPEQWSDERVAHAIKRTSEMDRAGSASTFDVAKRFAEMLEEAGVQDVEEFSAKSPFDISGPRKSWEQIRDEYRKRSGD